MSDQKKLRPGSKAWAAAAVELALGYAPRIGACFECKQPCAAGFICPSCGSGKGCYEPESGERIR